MTDERILSAVAAEAGWMEDLLGRLVESGRPGKRGVVARWDADGGDGRSPILNGHVDVVPPAAEHLWTHPPLRAVRDGEPAHAARADRLGFNAIDERASLRSMVETAQVPAVFVRQWCNGGEET